MGQIRREVEHLDDILAGPITVPGLETVARARGLPWDDMCCAARERNNGLSTDISWLEGFIVGRGTTDGAAGFDPLTATTASTSAEALELARAWADGRRSWWNQILHHEVGSEARQESLVRCAQMDAETSQTWSAIASAMASIERGS